MARNKTMSKEARKYVIDHLLENGMMTKSEVVDLVRPLCVVDRIALEEQEFGRIAARIIRSVKSEDGVRAAFIIKGGDTVVHLDTCKSLPDVMAIENQLYKQLEGVKASHKKAARRTQALSGQMALEDAAET